MLLLRHLGTISPTNYSWEMPPPTSLLRLRRTFQLETIATIENNTDTLPTHIGHGGGTYDGAGAAADRESPVDSPLASSPPPLPLLLESR